MSLLDRARQFLATRRHAYRTTFAGPLAEIVLRDLADHCFAQVSTFHKGMTREQCLVAQGRREAWLRISNHINLPDSELWKLYDGREDVS